MNKEFILGAALFTGSLLGAGHVLASTAGDACRQGCTDYYNEYDAIMLTALGDDQALCSYNYANDAVRTSACQDNALRWNQSAAQRSATDRKACTDSCQAKLVPMFNDHATTFGPLADPGYADRRWVADFDGNGADDYCRAVGTSWGAGSMLACAFSDGVRLLADTSVSMPVSDWGYADRRWMIDINGDKKADFCRAVGNLSGSGSYLGCSISTGSGFLPGPVSTDYTYLIPVSDWGYADRRWMVDFNGDGRVDFCRAVGNSSGPGSYLGCSISTGSAFLAGATCEFTHLIPVSDWGYAGRRFMADINNDHMADLCRGVGNFSGTDSYLGCSLSTGNGFQLASAGNDVLLPVSDWGYEGRRWMIDYNGDGEADFCRAVGEASGPGSFLGCSAINSTTPMSMPNDFFALAPVGDWGVSTFADGNLDGGAPRELCSLVTSTGQNILKCFRQ